MSLERELVFQLMKEGSSEKDVLEVAESMGDANILKTKPVNLDQRLIGVAISQYKAREELKKRRDYIKSDREKLRELIKEKEEEIRDRQENLLSVRIRKYG